MVILHQWMNLDQPILLEMPIKVWAECIPMLMYKAIACCYGAVIGAALRARVRMPRMSVEARVLATTM